MKKFRLPKSNCFLVCGVEKKYKNRNYPYEFKHMCGAFKTRKAAVEYIKNGEGGKYFYPPTKKYEKYMFVILDSNITNTYRNNKGFGLDSYFNRKNETWYNS